MSELFIHAHNELEAGRNLCLATIVHQIGSAPRATGTAFMVRADGSIWGTIGGGRLEAEIIAAAPQAMAKARAELVHFRLKGFEVAETEMLCGGDVDVYLEPLSASDAAAREIMAAACGVATRGGRALMVTPLLPGPLPSLAGRKLLVLENAAPVGGIEAAPQLAAELTQRLSELAPAGKSLLWMHRLADGGKLDLFVEPMLGRPTVYLFGGGHVSLPLARIVAMLDFRLKVMDDRPDFASQARFPMADEVAVRGFDDVFAGETPGPESYMIIITRGHVHDKDVLAQCLRTDACYVGMIGSRRKRDIIYKKLMEEGFTADDIARVHSPVGLDIGAETPEEIAVSIAAELVQERAVRRTNPRHLPHH